MKTIKTLKIEGMSCEHCVRRVSDALSAASGVISVDVNLRKKTARIELDSPVADEILIAVVTDAGYKVSKIK